MLRRLLESIYVSEQVEFASDRSLDEALAALRALTHHGFVSKIRHEVVVGKISPRKIKLSRHIPFVGNVCKPIFVGQLQHQGQGSVLRGRFGVSGRVKLALTAWICLSLVWITSSALTALSDHTRWSQTILGLVMLAAGVASVRLSTWLSRHDRQFLQSWIGHALAPQSDVVER